MNQASEVEHVALKTLVYICGVAPGTKGELLELNAAAAADTK